MPDDDALRPVSVSPAPVFATVNVAADVRLILPVVPSMYALTPVVVATLLTASTTCAARWLAVPVVVRAPMFVPLIVMLSVAPSRAVVVSVEIDAD